MVKIRKCKSNDIKISLISMIMNKVMTNGILAEKTLLLRHDTLPAVLV